MKRNIRFQKNFTLTLGIQIIAGLTIEELAGVMAHEFGHFSQSGSTFLHRMIQKINFWFAMAVYQPDAVDALIESTTDSDEGASSLSVLGFLLWILVGLGRIILWLLMQFGLFVSSSLLRRMEFDADQYEIGLVGSGVFKKTSKKMVSLTIAFQIAAEHTLRSNQPLHLPNDFATFSAGISEKSEMIKKKTIKLIRTEKPSLMASHPTTLSRIEAAEILDLPGSFKCSLSSKKLIKSFSRISNVITMEIYYHRFGDSFAPSEMRPANESIRNYLSVIK